MSKEKDKSESGATETKPTPENRAVKSGQVKVRALQALAEDGQFHDKGTEFETTPERAKALGSLVAPAK